MKYFSLDAAGVGALASCYYFVYTFMQVPAGVISDKYSMKLIATIAVTCCAVGAFVFVSTSNSYIAGFGQMLIGFGSSFAFILTLKCITDWFPQNKIAMMTSCTMSVGCLGPVVGGPAVSCIVREFEWTHVIKVFSVFGLLVAVLVWFTIRDKRKTQNSKQEHISLIDSLKMIVTSSQAWILALFTMMLYAPLSALGDLWGISFIKKAYGVDSTIAAFANNMLYVGVVFGSPFFAYLATRLNSYKKPMIGAATTATVALFFVIFCTGMPVEGIFVLFGIIGFACGAMLTYPLAIMIFPGSISATVSGFINMMSMLSGVILMPLIGYIINLSWDGTTENGVNVYSVIDYKYGLTTVLLFLIAGIITSLMIKDRSPNGQSS
jgi:MFS family permease